MVSTRTLLFAAACLCFCGGYVIIVMSVLKGKTISTIDIKDEFTKSDGKSVELTNLRGLLTTATNQVHQLQEQLEGEIKDLSSKPDTSEETSALKKQLAAALLDLHTLKEEKEKNHAADHAAQHPLASSDSINPPAAIRPGVIVLGMHRSGTSVVGGLMSKMGLETGGPLIGAAKDNAKGFFERIDVVLQNDYIMRKQQIDYSRGTNRYDAARGLTDVLTDESGKLFGKEGKKALAFLNNEKSFPWMLKDPRLCITLRTWLPLLKFTPSVLFVFRHPLDVALSLHKREGFLIGRGLRMWYVYNKRAIQQSNDLCRSVASHRRIMQQPMRQLNRIRRELTSCGTLVPHGVSQEDMDTFIDPKLIHGNNGGGVSTGGSDECVERYENGGDFSSLLPPSSWPTTEQAHIALYREVMRVYCAMEVHVLEIEQTSEDTSVHMSLPSQAYHVFTDSKFHWDDTISD